VFAPDHPDPNLQGKAKGTKAVLQEWESVWDELVSRCNGKVPVGKCKECSKSQAKKDAERRVAEAEAMGQEAAITEEDLAQLQEQSPDPVSNWCCIYHVLSLQKDFANEKPLLQQYVKKRGHVCIFLPKFHCELNPIEMLWGYAKYHEFPFNGLSLVYSM